MSEAGHKHSREEKHLQLHMELHSEMCEGAQAPNGVLPTDCVTSRGPAGSEPYLYTALPICPQSTAVPKR